MTLTRRAIAREFNASGGDFLCVGCLERRLGRTLLASDFTKASINEPSPWDTPRLAIAKGWRRIPCGHHHQIPNQRPRIASTA
jgi:hypothetical protein